MAACSSLQHIFENPLPENPTLIESLSSWNQIKSTKPIELSSFTEIFGELHFKENHPESSSSSPCLRPPSFSIISQPEMEKPNKYTDNNENKNPALDFLLNNQMNKYVGCHKKSDSFSSMNSESLQLCTEGLGFESLDDVEDMKNESTDDWQNHEKEKANITKHSSTDNLCGEFRRSRTRDRAFPPPISCIGRTGKPCVCFKSYRHDGRFVLKEIRIPTQEFLHACREDGRLKLHFVQPDKDIPEEEEEGEGGEENETEGEKEKEIGDDKENDADEQEDDEGN